ncbi:hypothetical protein GCM10011509_25140 [Ornithinimicrobium pekingense]|uniref:DUF559 domain-containing protein n=2 Tax=Ornithinimicrobium pekingense TaxID=384677 RepID=A0ABQ2F9Q1_9MICO|nr:hypothetical protein GCM10011509_25140 [Ornithinimicrobium pekingense]
MDKLEGGVARTGTLDRMTPFRPDRPFLHHEGVQAGISRRRLASDEFRRVLPGIYVAAVVPLDAATIGRATLLAAGPRAFLSHFQAARLHDGVVPETDVLHASVRGHAHRSRRPELQVHRSWRTPSAFRGLPVTSAEDTFVDLAAHLPLVDLVVLGDSLVRKNRTTPELLVHASGAAPAQLRRRAVRAARLVRQDVDSPMETRSRLLVVLAGLPEPEVDVCFLSRHGDLRRRLDMAYRRHRLALEYDGRQHAESQAQWESDVARREEFDGAGWRIITLLAKDIYRTPGRTLDRIVAAMQRAGCIRRRSTRAGGVTSPVTTRSGEWPAHAIQAEVTHGALT